MPKVNYLNEDFLTIGLLDCRHEFMNQFSIFLEKRKSNPTSMQQKIM